MRNMKKIIAITAILGLLGTAGAAFAATVKMPADIVAGLTGKTVEKLYEERAEGKTFGSIATEAGKLEEFKEEMLENKKSILDERVKDGRLTQEEADEIYNALKENQAACDGSGSAMIGKANSACFGNGQGMGRGNNQGFGKGAGMRSGNGMGFGRGVNR
ncbi:MAG: DUF2680 domain-containing protein [Clostridia bacterium]